MKCAFIALLIAIRPITAQVADRSPRAITITEARALVLASLSPNQRQFPRLGADQYDDPNNSKFLFFTVTREGPPNASVVVGNYAVDPQTGDVFSATIGCDEQKNKNLTALQTRIRARLRLSRTEYQRLKTKGPLCEGRREEPPVYQTTLE